jgi:TRAP-type mannitol/chloroaromatic compound transport system substrate-binding protein
MNKQQFDALPPDTKALVEEAYNDGYAAAVDVVSSCIKRVGDEQLDKQFTHNRDAILYMLKVSK